MSPRAAVTLTSLDGGDADANDTPFVLSWLASEVVATWLFLACAVHAAATARGAASAVAAIAELVAFVPYALAFERVGVSIPNYAYAADRVMMVGPVPLEIPLIEAVVVYAALRRAKFLSLPGWASVLAVGVASAVQDMTLDPVAVHDVRGDPPHARWTWVVRYPNGFFGSTIPFFNFSGWFVMCAYYAAFVVAGRAVHGFLGRPAWFGVVYPVAAACASFALLVDAWFPLTEFLLYGKRFGEPFSRDTELGLLLTLVGLGLSAIFVLLRVDKRFDVGRDGLPFAVPMVLHLFDLVQAVHSRQFEQVAPAFLFTALHGSFLAVMVGMSLRVPVRIAPPPLPAVASSPKRSSRRLARSGSSSSTSASATALSAAVPSSPSSPSSPSPLRPRTRPRSGGYGNGD